MIAALLTKPVSTKSATQISHDFRALTRDEELKGRVESYLDHQQSGLSSHVEVKVIAGIVVLQGTVTSYHQKQVAQECWKRVAGIVGVRNNLEVRFARAGEQRSGRTVEQMREGGAEHRSETFAPPPHPA